MALGGWRKFKTLKEARAYIKKAQAKGYFTSKPEKDGKLYWVSTLTKKGKNPFYMKGL